MNLFFRRFITIVSLLIFTIFFTSNFKSKNTYGLIAQTFHPKCKGLLDIYFPHEEIMKIRNLLKENQCLSIIGAVKGCVRTLFKCDIDWKYFVAGALHEDRDFDQCSSEDDECRLLKTLPPTFFIFDNYDSHREDIASVLDQMPSNVFWTTFNTKLNESTGRLLHHKIIPIPDGEEFSSLYSYYKSPWITNTKKRPKSSKLKSLIVWRGVTTGSGNYSNTDRYRTIMSLNNKTNSLKFVLENGRVIGTDVYFSAFLQGVTADVVPIEYKKERLTNNYMIETSIFQLDVDGNANAWTGLRWKLCSGSPILKVESSKHYAQWYYQNLFDGEHLFLTTPESIVNDTRRLLGGLSAKNESSKKAFKKLSDVAMNARVFCARYLTKEARDRYLRNALANCYNNIELHKTKDWRLKRGKQKLIM